MAEVQAHVIDKSDRGRGEDRRLMQESNMAGVTLTDFRLDANLNRKPDHMIYVFSIVPRRFEVRRPPAWPRIVFEPCGANEDCKLVGTFPSPVNEVTWMEDRTFVTSVTGEYFVRDLLNPGGVSGERPDSAINEQAAWFDGGTADLTRRGLFMSLCNPPKPEEIERCRARMQTHYRSLLQQADQLDRANRRREIGPEHHDAAEYFQYKANWHYVQTAPTPCPNCGELVRPGLAYHINPAGGVCVIDWRRAVQAGVKTLEEVPESERWEGLSEAVARQQTSDHGTPRKRRAESAMLIPQGAEADDGSGTHA